MSSGSESDEDFVPGEPEVVSEEDSADEETDLQYDNEQETKAQKRKAKADKKGNKRRKSKPIEETVEEKLPETEVLDPEAEKKREDDLWAMFLDGTDNKPKPKETTVKKDKAQTSKVTKEIPQTSTSKTNNEDEDRERRIFEFAGETIVVENNVIKEKYKAGEGPADVKKLVPEPARARSSGGLSSVLGHLNKKNKLSTLDKSKLDWETLKKTEGVEEEIKSFNKGKQGYLDRQDFLQRADLREYELERDARLTRRSNR